MISVKDNSAVNKVVSRAGAVKAAASRQGAYASTPGTSTVVTDSNKVAAEGSTALQQQSGASAQDLTLSLDNADSAAFLEATAPVRGSVPVDKVTQSQYKNAQAKNSRPLLSLSKNNKTPNLALANPATALPLMLSDVALKQRDSAETKAVVQQSEDAGWYKALQEENRALKEALMAARRQIANNNKSLELLKHQSQYDGLTNTPNRLLLQDRFQQALRQAKRSEKLLGLMFIDLDHFKKINDIFGHNTGDLVLQAVSQRLQQSIRSSDTLCRYGGDEFVLLLPVLLHLSDAKAIAAKIIRAIAAPLQLNDQLFELSGSLGIAVYPADGDSIAALTSAADQAMYQAKAKGGGCFVFNGLTQLPQLKALKLMRGSSGGVVLQRQRLY